MIKLIRQFVAAAKAGSHSGKGHKFTRQGKYEEALRHYQLALEYESEAYPMQNPASVECIARTHARLGNYKEALSVAKQAHELYKQLSSDITAPSMARVERFMLALKENDKDEITEILSI